MMAGSTFIRLPLLALLCLPAASSQLAVAADPYNVIFVFEDPEGDQAAGTAAHDLVGLEVAANQTYLQFAFLIADLDQSGQRAGFTLQMQGARFGHTVLCNHGNGNPAQGLGTACGGSRLSSDGERQTYSELYFEAQDEANRIQVRIPYEAFGEDRESAVHSIELTSEVWIGASILEAKAVDADAAATNGAFAIPAPRIPEQALEPAPPEAEDAAALEIPLLLVGFMVLCVARRRWQS